MSGASVEQVLGLWSAELGGLKARIRPLFAHPSVSASAAAFLEGVLGPERRKTGWMRAEAAGDPGPWRQQAVLGRSRWDAEALRDLVRDYAVEALAAPDAVLVVDETGFPKQGNASCGVKRQYTGSAGKITNCQIGVFAAYVSDKGHAFIDRRLYLPKEWTDKPARLAAAHAPAAVPFATKPHLAVGMIGRAIEAGVPFAWVAADSVYGVGEVEMALRRAGKGYVLAVTATSRFWSWGKEPVVAGTAEQIAAALPASRYVRLSAGGGTKGPRLYDRAYLELADLDAARDYPGSHGVWTRGLLIRRSLIDQELAFFATWCPRGTPIDMLVRVEGRRWAIEDAFETAKTELGLDHNRHGFRLLPQGGHCATRGSRLGSKSASTLPGLAGAERRSMDRVTLAMHPEPSDAPGDREPKFLRSRRRVQRQASGPHLSEARAAEPWDAALLRAEPPAPHHHLQGVADISAWRFARSGRLEARRAVHRRPDQPEQLLVLGAVGAPDQELADPGARSSARRTRRWARA